MNSGQFTDQMGRDVLVAHQPQRIVCLVPSITELLFDLGLGNHVVGVTRFCIHPETARKNSVNIGGTKKLHLDRIATLKPDLIIGSKEENTRAEITRLWDQHPVWMSDVETIADGIEMIRQLGSVCRVSDRANEIANKIEQSFTTLNNDVPTIKIRVAYLIWYNPIMVSGRANFITDVLHCAGWQNAFETGDYSGSNRYPTVTMDDLKKTKPNVVLLSSEPFPFSEKHIQEFEKELNCPAILVDGELFSWYGSRMLKMPDYLKKVNVQINSAHQ